MAVVWCHRRTKRNWTGKEPPPKDIHYGGDEFITRSTMVFRKEVGEWRVVARAFFRGERGRAAGRRLGPGRHSARQRLVREANVTDLPKLSVRLHGGIEAEPMHRARQSGRCSGVSFDLVCRERVQSRCAAGGVGMRGGHEQAGYRHRCVQSLQPPSDADRMEIGALDELARGRARLGIGSGIAAATERMGLSPDRPLARVRDAITIVRAMLKGKR
jgi:hypothetical protein